MRLWESPWCAPLITQSDRYYLRIQVFPPRIVRSLRSRRNTSIPDYQTIASNRLRRSMGKCSRLTRSRAKAQPRFCAGYTALGLTPDQNPSNPPEVWLWPVTRPVRCLPARGCRSPHGRVSACSRDSAQLSEPMGARAKTESVQVLRPPNGITVHGCGASHNVILVQPRRIVPFGYLPDGNASHLFHRLSVDGGNCGRGDMEVRAAKNMLQLRQTRISLPLPGGRT